MEIRKKTAVKIAQIYPRNFHDYIKCMSVDKAEIHTLTPSINSIMAMGGLDILWPLTDILFMFNNSRIKHLHQEVALCIRLFNESMAKFPVYKSQLVKSCITDSRIEGYYRKHIEMTGKTSILINKTYVHGEEDEDINFEHLFLGQIPFHFLLFIFSKS